jgi:hypothetical protein
MHTKRQRPSISINVSKLCTKKFYNILLQREKNKEKIEKMGTGKKKKVSTEMFSNQF